MDELEVKQVNFLGDALMEARDKNGDVWVGVSYICNGIGFNKGQKDAQVEKIQKDVVLSQGCRKLPAGVFDPSNMTLALKLDFVPLWLAKITLTSSMSDEATEKLINYQLKAKDVLAAAFLPQLKPLTTAEQLVAQAQLLLNMETKLNAVTERMDSTETLLLDVGAKAEEAVSKLDTAIKVYSRPDKDHWQSDMAESIKGIVAVNGWPEPKFRGKLYKELEDTVGHTNINTRLKRLRDRKRGTGATYRESMAFTKLDAIAASKELRLIFEGIVKKYQAQLTGGK